MKKNNPEEENERLKRVILWAICELEVLGQKDAYTLPHIIKTLKGQIKDKLVKGA